MTDKRFLPELEDGEELAPADQMYYDDMAWWSYERHRRKALEERMLSRGKRTRKAAPPLYPRESIADGELRSADGRRLKRGDTVRNPERWSSTLMVRVPGKVGVVVDIYRRGDQYLVEVRLDGKDGAAGRAVFQADRVRRSQAAIHTEAESLKDPKEAADARAKVRREALT